MIECAVCGKTDAKSWLSLCAFTEQYYFCCIECLAKWSHAEWLREAQRESFGAMARSARLKVDWPFPPEPDLAKEGDDAK